MRYVLALDQGTTSSRAILFDHDGRAVAIAQEEFPQHFPRAGWVEQDPLDIWNTQLAVTRAVLERAGAGATDVAAIGITNQRETTLLWDRQTGEPIHRAIVWQDRRTAPHCEALIRAGHEETVRRKTGLIIDPYFSATKLAWMLENVDGARVRADAGELAFGTVDSWIIWNLTEGRTHATDATNASRTMLYDIEHGVWDEQLLELFDIPDSVLPRVVPSVGVIDETTVFGGSIPVAGVAGDQQAALFGQIGTHPGIVKNTYGTGCFLLMYTGTERVRSEHRLVTTVALQTDARMEYALEGSIFTGGAVVQWLRDGLGLISESEEVESLAGQAADNGGVYLVPAFTGLGAPHWDPYARGTILGLTRGTGAAHIARAALESIAYQSTDVIRAMEADAGIPVEELRADGGASANDLLMQFQADLLGVPVARSSVLETTALGAAYLAGLATGFWRSREELAAHWKLDRRFEPAMPRDHAERLLAEWHRALDRARDWADREP